MHRPLYFILLLFTHQPECRSVFCDDCGLLDKRLDRYSQSDILHHSLLYLLCVRILLHRVQYLMELLEWEAIYNQLKVSYAGDIVYEVQLGDLCYFASYHSRLPILKKQALPYYGEVSHMLLIFDSNGRRPIKDIV